MIISKNTNLIILLYTSITGYTIDFGTVKAIYLYDLKDRLSQKAPIYIGAKP